MRRALLLAVVLCSPSWLSARASTPVSEEDKGTGFSDLAFAAAGTFVSSADGTVRRLEGDTLPVVFEAGRKLVSIAASEDGQQLAAVGAGVVARSSDGGRTFHAEPTPDGVMAYAIAFSRGELLLFDVKGRGFRSPRSGAGFLPLELPRAIRYWTASFSGPRGFVVGEGGVLLATEDGGTSWKVLASPARESEAVLAVGQKVWVSGQEGIFLSDDGGQHFRRVFESTGNCYRMGARGRAVVAACAPLEHVLVYSADGEHFQEVPVADAANMMAAGITPDGQLVAVGAYEVLVRANTQRGRLIVTSKAGERWLEVRAKVRAEQQKRAEQNGRAAPAQASEEPQLPAGVVWRSGEQGVLAGDVRNSRGAPLAGITVELVGSWAVHGEGYQKVKTDAQGHYRFAPSKVGSARVSVTAPEYAPVSRVIPLNPTGETALELALQVQVLPDTH